MTNIKHKSGSVLFVCCLFLQLWVVQSLWICDLEPGIIGIDNIYANK